MGSNGDILKNMFNKRFKSRSHVDKELAENKMRMKNIMKKVLYQILILIGKERTKSSILH